MKIRIALVDDHPLIINGISNLLSSYKSIEIIGKYSSGKELLDGIQKKQPDILLLDISLPDMTGNDLARAISKKHPQIRIIALTSIDTPFQVKDMMQHGCSGYLLKNTAPETIIEAITKVHNGEQFIDPTLKDQLLQAVLQPIKNDQLTKREQEVLSLICAGKTNNEIAKQLFLSLRTIENHRFSLYQKFNVNNTAALVKLALEKGLI